MNKNEQEYLVQRIRTQYTEKEHTELDELRELDKRVKTPAKLFGYAFGTLSALIMGCGMSLIMTDLGQILGLSDPRLPGIMTGIVGMAMAIANYPIFKAILTGRRRRYADRIIELSDKLVNN